MLCLANSLPFCARPFVVVARLAPSKGKGARGFREGIRGILSPDSVQVLHEIRREISHASPPYTLTPHTSIRWCGWPFWTQNSPESRQSGPSSSIRNHHHFASGSRCEKKWPSDVAPLIAPAITNDRRLRDALSPTSPVTKSLPLTINLATLTLISAIQNRAISIVTRGPERCWWCFWADPVNGMVLFLMLRPLSHQMQALQ